MDPSPTPRAWGIRRIARCVWIGLCAAAGALIAGALAGFTMSSLGVGLAAAAPGAALGWLFGRYISPVDVFLPM